MLWTDFLPCCYACGQPTGNNDLLAKLNLLFYSETTLERQKEAVRVLQYLCITVLCQVVSTEWFCKYSLLDTYIVETIAKLNANETEDRKRVAKKWKDLIPHYMNLLITVMYSCASLQYLELHNLEPQPNRIKYQLDFGYQLYSKYWLFFDLIETETKVPENKRRKRTEEKFPEKVCLVMK